MAGSLLIAGGVLAGLGAISSLLGGNKAAKKAKAAAAEEARLEGLVTAEKIRSLKVDERVLRGETIAGAAGSGVVANRGSPLDVLAEQASEFARERGITQMVGASKASLATQRGSLAATRYKYGGISNAAGQFGNMFSLIHSGVNWP